MIAYRIGDGDAYHLVERDRTKCGFLAVKKCCPVVVDSKNFFRIKHRLCATCFKPVREFCQCDALIVNGRCSANCCQGPS